MRITDRKRLGFKLAKKEGQKSYEILQKLGLEYCYSLPISAKMIIFACVFGLILADTLNYEIYISIRICSKVWCL